MSDFWAFKQNVGLWLLGFAIFAHYIYLSLSMRSHKASVPPPHTVYEPLGNHIIAKPVLYPIVASSTPWNVQKYVHLETYSSLSFISKWHVKNSFTIVMEKNKPWSHLWFIFFPSFPVAYLPENQDPIVSTFLTDHIYSPLILCSLFFLTAAGIIHRKPKSPLCLKMWNDPTSEQLPKGLKGRTWKDIYTPMFPAVLLSQ